MKWNEVRSKLNQRYRKGGERKSIGFWRNLKNSKKCRMGREK